MVNPAGGCSTAIPTGAREDKVPRRAEEGAGTTDAGSGTCEGELVAGAWLGGSGTLVGEVGDIIDCAFSGAPEGTFEGALDMFISERWLHTLSGSYCCCFS